MLEIDIIEPSGGTTSHRLEPGHYRLGKGQNCEIHLPDRHVSRHHATLVVSAGGGLYLEDAGSTNGIWRGEDRVNGTALAPGDELRMGRLTMRTRLHGQPKPDPARDAEATRRPPPEPPPRPPPPPRVERDEETAAFKAEVHELLLAHLDKHKRGVLHRMSAGELRDAAREAAQEVIRHNRLKPPRSQPLAELTEEIVAEAIGLGPIERFMAEESVTEVMVNGANTVYVERDGRIEPTGAYFNGNASLMAVIERIVAPLGRRIDEGSPMVDARLPDGSRVNAIIPPLALNGPTLTIRKFFKDRLTIDDLIDRETMSREMSEFLKVCVEQRKNIVVSGGTGSGKTTTLNVLSNFIPASDRIVTIEDAAELQLHQEHVVSLEARPANIEGKGEVTIRDLMRNALRMRPDRIVVGECRGGEALDMLQAMNTGHDGSLTTGHANSPRDLLSRLEVMVLMAGFDLPVRAVREQVASAIDIIIQQTRFSDGKRRITSIVEVDGMEGDVVLLQSVFKFVVSNRRPDGSIVGEYKGSGYAPAFYRELEESGVAVDRGIFGKAAGGG